MLKSPISEADWKVTKPIIGHNGPQEGKNGAIQEIETVFVLLLLDPCTQESKFFSNLEIDWIRQRPPLEKYAKEKFWELINAFTNSS